MSTRLIELTLEERLLQEEVDQNFLGFFPPASLR